MNPRQLLRLAVVLAVLLLLWGAVALARRRSDEGPKGPRPLGVDTAAVDSVLLVSTSDSVKLVRNRADWTVNGFKAAPEEVSGLLRELADTARGELIAENPASHARLGVDSTGGRRVRVKNDGKVVLDLLVGSSESGFGTGYLRRSGEAAVYRIRSRLPELAGRKTDEWRDKTIVTLPADSIGSIAIRRGSQEYGLRRDGKRWRLGSGGTADSARVANLLGDLSRIRAAGFATPTQAASLRFTRPDRRLTIKSISGQSLASLLFDSTSSGIWVRHDSAGRGTVWRVESWDWDRIMPERKSLD
jgi:hypothetical protein